MSIGTVLLKMMTMTTLIKTRDDNCTHRAVNYDPGILSYSSARKQRPSFTCSRFVAVDHQCLPVDPLRVKPRSARFQTLQTFWQHVGMKQHLFHVIMAHDVPGDT